MKNSTFTEDALSCYGHYGYGSGWKQVRYCEGCCSKRIKCYGVMAKLFTGVMLVEAEGWNRLCGLSDREEGGSRFRLTQVVTLGAGKKKGEENLYKV